MVDQAPNPETSEEIGQQEAKDRVMTLVNERLEDGDFVDFRMAIFDDSDYEKEVFDLIAMPAGISFVTKRTYTAGGRIPAVTNPVPKDFYKRYETELTQVLSPRELRE